MATLRVIRGGEVGRTYDLPQSEVYLGRQEGCELRLCLDTVSRRHARIVREADEYFVEDLGSTNGTYVDGDRIAGRRQLTDGSVITIDKVMLAFQSDRSSGSTPAPGLARSRSLPTRPTILASLDVREVQKSPTVRPEVMLRALQEIMQSVGRSLVLDEVLPKVLDALARIFPQADRLYILLRDGGGGLQLRAIKVAPESGDSAITIRPISRAIAEQVMENGKAILSTDAGDSPAAEASVIEHSASSLMCAPLVGPTRRPLGVIHVDASTATDAFGEADLEVLASVASLAGQVVEYSRLHDKHVQSARLAAIGQTVASVAHETRNSLLSLEMGLNMLAEQAKDRPEMLELIGHLKNDQQQLHRVLDEVRSYSAPINLDLRSADLRDCWRQVWSKLEPYRKGRQAVLEESCDGLDLSFAIDETRMRQVFRNLLENSLAACGDPLRIEVSAEEVEAHGQPAVRVSVRDNGPGLDSECRQRIFEPFFTTKSDGTGLGMAIVKRIVEAHEGQIEVSDETGRGAEFVITLPRREAVARTTPRRTPAGAVSS